MTRLPASDPLDRRPEQAVGAFPNPLEGLGYKLLQIEHSLCRPAWLDTLVPEHWPVLADPLESLDGMLRRLADSVWEEVQAGAQAGQAEALYTGLAGEERLFPFRSHPTTVEFDQQTTRVVKRDPTGSPVSVTPPPVGRTRGQTVQIQPSDSSSAQTEVSGSQPVNPNRPVVRQRPASLGRAVVHTGLPRRPLDLPAARPESSATDDDKNLRSLPVSTPVVPPNPVVEKAGEKEPATAFTGARLVSDPSRLAAVLQANLHPRERSVTGAPLPAAPDHDSGIAAVPGNVSFTPPVAPGSPQSAVPGHEGEISDVLTPVVEPLDAARLEQMVEEQFTRWLEDIELAYLRTYGTSGI